MDNNQDGIDYLQDLSKNLAKFSSVIMLGDGLQKGTRLSKTASGARTNARIEAAQKREPFIETETSLKELSNVTNDITNELLNRAIEDIFGK